jgi:hypothetical protein
MESGPYTASNGFAIAPLDSTLPFTDVFHRTVAWLVVHHDNEISLVLTYWLA